ncbi:MAG: hypothetical protein CVV56_04885 [Tenericutes bacterium HGW-Tenericutes-1]|nr:MAG: hypothetical protein CVV56_04885 [Tenericutes bacterium HGW-Tenericutes-1]
MNNHPLEDLSKRYLSENNFSNSTVKSYGFAFMHYIKYLKEHDIEFAKTSDVIKFREIKRNLGYSTTWIYIQISALKGLYRYLRINQKNFVLPLEYAYDIMIPIKNEKINPVIKKPILTLEQAKYMILHTKEIRKSFWHYRNHAIVYLMLTSGLRSYEILRAKREDYKLVDGGWLLYFPSNKSNSTESYVKLSKGAALAMNDYLNLRHDDNPYLFITHQKGITKKALSRMFFMHMFRSVLKECGLDNLGITPHCLRHTAATVNLLRGGTVESTKQFLRHTCIESTLVYVHHIERMKDDSERQIDAFILKEEPYHYHDDNEFLIFE